MAGPSGRQGRGQDEGIAPSFEGERARCAARRRGLGIERPGDDDGRDWGLSLSGGGIRSATFALGVLQGLVKSRVPGAGGQAGAGSSLLRQFDYLSTVSGGGYIGSFFGSLFRPGRVRPAADPQSSAAQVDAAEAAYAVLGSEPPGRLRRDLNFDPQRPGETMLAWLRENGRYMAPTGSGDLFYAFAMALRNWVAMNFVLGTMVVFAFALLSLGRIGLVHLDVSIGHLSFAMIEQAMLPGKGEWLWWSPLGWGAVAIAIGWVGPAGLAYWQAHPAKGETLSARPRLLSSAARHIALLGVGLLALPVIARVFFYGGSVHDGDWGRIAYVLWLFGAVSLGSSAFYVATTRARTVSSQRVVLTRLLARGLVAFSLMLLVASVDTAAQSLYLQLSQDAAWATPASLMAALVWGVRRIALASSEKQRSGLLAKLPLGAIATGAALALLVLVMILWDLVVIWLSWGGEPAVANALAAAGTHRAQNLGITVAFAAILILEASRYPGFLNLSSLQSLYAARLTRAYLGASNRQRFEASDKDSRSVAEPHANDHVTLDDYYANPLMPIHLVNVCVNQNNDPAEQLVQRDRKGKPMALVPGGFTLDGRLYPMPRRGSSSSEMDAELTIGDWVGVSGAAVSTGMGRASGFGFSLLLTLANVRLGRWWRSGVFRAQTASGRTARNWLPTQRYLLSELLGSFYGTNRERQYLSDGGHFENTGIYELLNPARGLRLIVTADCGCDPNYEFGDLANLIRLARIDYGVEIEVDREAAFDSRLGNVFGTVDQFGGDAVSDKCAVLLKVYRTVDGRKAATPHQRIVLLKPRRLSSTGADVVHYQKAHPVFPQEPTSDQFFDEAQWESYRRLGFEVARRVFGDPDETYQQELWSRLLAPA